MNYTSIEQSKKLLELGLSPESADIFIPCYGEDKYTEFRPYFREHVTKPDRGDLPCWSVGALLEVIHNIEINDGFFDMMLWKSYDGWVLECANAGENKCNKSLIDTCYDMVVWLLENNYIKKEGNT